MTEKHIYDIKELDCAYSDARSHIVLHIEQLHIEKGKIVFFVGPSGVGKSTILETLGLMNNTINHVERFDYEGQDIRDVWSWDDKRLSAFRNSEFSFIFQENNLMPNFTAFENVMVTAMLQGEDTDGLRQRTHHVLEALGLPHSEDRSIAKFSGGQRQRLAFARAILPKFNVLFGDEPTGNLDPATAQDLVELMTRTIHERRATAIIVSHDMRLATRYADVIVAIEKEKMGMGIINEDSCYHKIGNEWCHNGQTFSNDTLQLLLTEQLSQ